MTRVLGISGSLRRGSHNTRLLRAAAGALPPAAGLELYTNLAAIPPFEEERDGPFAPAAVKDLRRSVAGSDALLVATPEYNSSIPGQLKNAVDWLSRPFPGNALQNKPVAVIGASTGMFGAVWAQAELRKVLRATGARVLDSELAVPRADQAFAQDGELVDEELSRRLEAVLAELVEQARARERAAA